MELNNARHYSCLPILLVFFDRPQLVPTILTSLRRIQPKYLFLACDGPKYQNDEISRRVQESKQLLRQGINWPCQIYENYADKNLGCDLWVPLAIDWFFSKVEFGVILEDDCLITSDFCRFAFELLLKYRDVDSVMNISAPNFQLKKWGDGDYYYSYYPSNWGWATWRRAWKQFNQDILDLDHFLSPEGSLHYMNLGFRQKSFWRHFFKGLECGRYTYWDAKWVYAIWKSKGLSITPNVNLSSNIGFGESATHTKIKDSGHEMPIYRLPEKITHPSIFGLIQYKADEYLFMTRYKPTLQGYFSKLLNKLTGSIK